LYRLIIFVLATLAAPLQLHADPIDDLLAAAHRSDFAAVDAQIRTAADRTTQRDLVWALAATDPDTVTFTKEWLAAQADNPVALTARAWSIYWAGGRVRGELSRFRTWPPLLEEADQMYREALSLAERASKLDPGFLPASDAVILLRSSTGAGEEVVAELERVMAVDPNRHSLILATSAMAPAWGGSLELMQALCGHFAASVADVPDFDAETCLAQAILRAQIWGNAMDWAISVVDGQADKPFLEREVMQLARHNLLPATGVSFLGERLRSEGRMSVYAILAPQKDLLETTGPSDPDEFLQALATDLSIATQAADRDPGYAGALLDLRDLYEIEIKSIGLREIRDPDTTEAEHQAIYDEVIRTQLRHAEDLDRRARRLLELAPRNAPSLQFASRYVLAPDPDPLQADRWALTLLTNATVYANYQERQLGQIILEAKRRYDLMQSRMASGEVPTYSAAELEDVYLCPYVRAIRVLDEVCAHHETGEQYCVMEAILAYPSDSQISYSLYGTLAEQRVCASVRDAPIDSLAYEITDPASLP
jgi:nitrate reductase assembly molybdenum cofactor insertion protein NarJ